MIKGIYTESKANITLNGKVLNDFLQRLGAKSDVHSIVVQQGTRRSSLYHRAKKKKKLCRDRKYKIRSYWFIGGMIYIENHTASS